MHWMRRTPSHFHIAFSLLACAAIPSAAFAQKAVLPPTTKPVLDSGELIGVLLGTLWEGIRSFWIVWLLLIVIGLVRCFLSYRRQAALAAAGIEEIDRMDGRSFEQRLAILFRQLGYAVELTPYAGDWGGDLVLCKDGVKTVVQAKRYKKAVGVRAVQEAVAAKAKYGCAEAMVVTNNIYTCQARELARANRVTLWDRSRLVQALLSVKRDAPSTGWLAASSNPVLSNPSGVAQTLLAEQACFLCHKPVSEKVAAFCQANPARFGGRIYCFDHQKLAPRLERSLQ